ncbi:MAG TPA: tripartite tricarboxylate transporter substrate binding protein [Xanthobacteraceae bacterium]|nr:tripartite tricarboxylate transporter substrate binding protein [Xanthobacteraceae bacterium]
MMLRRRQFLHLATAAGAAGAGLSIGPRAVRAESYPARSVRIVVGSPPGGTYDIVARLIAQWLSGRLGQQFVVDNRPGAGTNIASDLVAHAAADGYTLLLAGSPAAINVSLYDKLNFNFLTDIAPVAPIERMPLVMAVNPALPANSVSDFIAYAKGRAGAINMGSGGVGSTGHVAGELFRMMADIRIAHVPYRGEPPALTDLIGGRLDVVFSTAGSLIGYVKAGSLRALAVTTEAPLAALPGIPPLQETLPGYEASSWTGIGAPAHTPAEVVERLNHEINAGLADAKVSGQLGAWGATILAAPPSEFGDFIAAEAEKWRKVVRSADLKPD